MIWGAYGANAVHMSILLEYMAARIDCAVGTYYQFSNNLHAYVDTLEKVKNIEPDYDPYLTLNINKKPVLVQRAVTTLNHWLMNLLALIKS